MAIVQTLDSSLTWAIPVSPTDLCIGLNTFKRMLPALRSLRLCHRFGRGPNVHITKLPNELELVIEEFLLSKVSNKIRLAILDEYRCFESRCDPWHHGWSLGEEYEMVGEMLHRCDSCEQVFYASDRERHPDMYDDEDFVKEDYCMNRCDSETSEPCNPCQANMKPEDCERICANFLRDGLNNHVLDNNDEWEESHDEQIASWSKRISQTAGGGFVKFDKLLAKHFGLRAVFSTTRVNTSDQAAWVKHKNHKWHHREPETTLCFLTLPKNIAARNAKYSPSELEADLGFFDIQATQAIHIKPATLSDSGTPRFLRALKLLRLQPYVHPATVSSSSSETSKNVSDWPQLMLLVKSNCEA